MALAFRITLKNGRGENTYDQIVAKYENATPSTSRHAREIKQKKNDASGRVEVQQPDYSKPKSLISLKFDNEKDDGADDRKEFGNLVVKHKHRIIANVEGALGAMQVDEEQLAITPDNT